MKIMIQFYDEVEFTPFIYNIIMASAPAYKTASAHAKRNRAVHGRVFITTPGDLDSQPTQDALKIISKTARWTERMYDFTKQELADYLESNAKESGIVYVEYNYKQLGEGEEWLNEMSRLLMYDQITIRREIHLQRLNGSNNSPFSMEDLMAITDLKKQPIREEIIMGRYKLDIYKDIDRRKIVIVSVDTSTGIGQDNNAITIINPDTLEPVAEFKCPYMSSPDLRKFVYILVKKYYPNAIITPERNMGGYALVDELLQTDIGHRIYYEDKADITSNMDAKLDSDGYLKREAAQRRVRGVQTTGKSRELMMKILNTHVQDHKEKFITQNITSDLNNLILTKTGKVEAAKGQHDDSIMSYLIGLYVIYYGKNLAKFGYVRGINSEEKEQNSGLIYDENTILSELERYSDGTVDVQSFKSASKDVETSYDEYERLIMETRRKMNAYHDPYSINEARSVGEEYESNTSASIPLSLFSELNS